MQRRYRCSGNFLEGCGFTLWRVRHLIELSFDNENEMLAEGKKDGVKGLRKSGTKVWEGGVQKCQRA